MLFMYLHRGNIMNTDEHGIFVGAVVEEDRFYIKVEIRRDGKRMEIGMPSDHAKSVATHILELCDAWNQYEANKGEDK